MRVRVRSLVHMVGLKPGQEAEIDFTEKVRELIRAGYLQALRPKSNG